MSLSRVALGTTFLFSVTIGQSRAELPQDAQEAMKNGLQAAKQQEWEIAIRSFQEARKIAPDAAEVFYNLGLAESKIPGRELRAMAWFGAFLATSPHAPNAAAINDFIIGLRIKNQGNLSRLVRSVQDAAGHDNYIYLTDAVNLWSEAGDVTAAAKIPDLLKEGEEKSMVQCAVVRVQAHTGDVAGAERTAEQIQDIIHKAGARETIAQFQVQAGDIAGAKKTLESVLATTAWKLPQYSLYIGFGECKTLVAIAKGQITAGNIADSKETLSSALKLVTLIKDFGSKVDALEDIAKAQAKAGDVTGAKVTLASAVKTADGDKSKDPFEPKAFYRDRLKSYISATKVGIAKELARSGDCAAAQELCPSKGGREAYEAYAKSDQARLESSSESPNATSSISVFITALDYLKLLDDDFGECPLNSAPFLDLARYLTAQHSDDPGKLFDALRDTARTIIKAQKVIDEMLKRQAKQQAKP